MVVMVVEGLSVCSMLLQSLVRAGTEWTDSHLVQIALWSRVQALLFHWLDDHVICGRIDWRFASATVLTAVAVQAHALVSRYLLLVKARRRRWERRSVMLVRTCEAEHQVIDRWAVMMMLVVLMVVYVADVHVVPHWTGWLQRERLRIVVVEA